MVMKRKSSNDNRSKKRRKRLPPTGPYLYEPLSPGQIRILILDAGSENDPLCGKLEIVSMEDEPEYRAISYAWGEPVFPHPLSLSGRQLKITNSLFGALRCFRHLTESVRLWADAVCINQDELDEKSHQVEMMAEIYRCADEVLVWLGEEQGTDCLANWTIPRLLEFAPNFAIDSHGTLGDAALRHELPKFLEEKSSSVPRNIDCSCGTHLSLDLENFPWVALGATTSSLWSRPYFQRLWVIQEYAIARSVKLHFGRHKVDGEDLAKAVDVLWQREFFTNFDSRTFGDNRDQIQRCLFLTQVRPEVKGQSLLRLLLQTSDSIAKEPQDRIFAIRTLANIEHVTLFKPSYALAPRELWARAIVFILTEPSSWDLRPHLSCECPFLALALVGTQGRGTSLPSWVVDFAKLNRESRKKQSFYIQEARKFRAGGDMRMDLVYDPDQAGIIRLRGVIASRVSTTCSGSESRLSVCDRRCISLDDYWTNVKRYLIAWYSQCRLFVRDFASHFKSEPGSLERLLKQGGKVTFQAGPTHEEFETACEDVLYDQYSDQSNRPDIAQVYSDLNAFLAWTIVDDWDLDLRRRLATTVDGWVGWVPDSSQPEDLLCLFQGSPFPFVIRERGDGYYTLIGDAYIDGIMLGEVWPDDEKETAMIGLK